MKSVRLVKTIELAEQIRGLRSEKNVPANRVAERNELLDAAQKLEQMLTMHMYEGPDEVAELYFKETGERRNCGEERRTICEFSDILERKLNLYFS